jgi:3-oxoacyl-[acyl-carrier protein] reductase
MFEGKTALVTGASRGIGQQIAQDLENLGADVISTDTKSLDFTNPESVTKFVKTLEGRDIDICVNNAGINKINHLDKVDDSDWQDILDVNLTGPFKIMRAVLSGMMNRGQGRIVNIASVWSHKAPKGRVAYSSTKYGLRGLTTAIAAEAAPKGVLVNSVSPGFTRTELTEATLGQEGMRGMEKLIPLGRLAEPVDISNVVIFLCSDLNTYISGQDIVVDGGFLNA